MSHSSDEDTSRLRKIVPPPSPTVLIVGDDELLLERLKEWVSAGGTPVLSTSSGHTALKWLEDSAASIVVTEVRGIGGLELCRRIRTLERHDPVYVILLTADDEETDVLAGFDAGADDYISNRVSAAQFRARLRTATRILALEYHLNSAPRNKHMPAMTDELTGVYNRRYFLSRLGATLKNRRNPGGLVSLLLVDIDHFKGVNDRYGHAAGDALLKALTEQITHCLRRPTDWCARLGGEEVAVVLENTDLSEARACAERVRRSIAKHRFGTSGNPIRVTVSVGVSGVEHLPEQDSVEPLTLLALADCNLQSSKAEGRNRVTSSNPGDVPIAVNGR